ncbi:MAG: inositol monophosphatase [Candidatus Pelagibacter sp. TMED118]|nr:MAG: inositol monophosphatase [Candidatus Pelagibacter sp. TMED118]|tara:strand:+ start:11524 stop:12264 length:741 start_codon:yes stop_codon:yes gene_type:complete
MNSISAELNMMIKASEKASKILIRDFGEIENLQVSKKGPNDFVTNSDRNVEKVIINELTKFKKNFSIISEEAGVLIKGNNENIWIIDPIDGTNNFLHGIPHFCISIALQSKNEIVSGVIFDPIKNEIFYAEKNNGSYYNNHRMKVSKKKNLEDCLFSSNAKFKEINDINLRITGSAALDLAYVGCGRFDGYFQKNLNIWDIAAGIIIVKESGGIINEVDLSTHNKMDILASSDNIHKKLVNRLDKF